MCRASPSHLPFYLDKCRQQPPKWRTPKNSRMSFPCTSSKDFAIQALYIWSVRVPAVIVFIGLLPMLAVATGAPIPRRKPTGNPSVVLSPERAGHFLQLEFPTSFLIRR
jgi:hypothetical protein